MAKNIFIPGTLLLITVFGLILAGCKEPCSINCEYYLNSEKSCFRTKCAVEQAKDINKYAVTCNCN